MSLSYSNYTAPFNTSTAGLKSQPGLKFLHVTSPLSDILTRFIEIFNFLRGVLRACIRRFGDFMAILINFDNFWQDFWESFFFIVEEVHV